MSIKLVCPDCSRALFAPEEVLGETVKCEHCGATFTARAGAKAKVADPPPRREPDPEPVKSTARRKSRDDDDDDPQPRRKAARVRKGTNPLPFLLAGGGLALFALAVCGGVFAVLWTQTRNSNPQTSTGPNISPLPNQAPNVQPFGPQGGRLRK